MVWSDIKKRTKQTLVVGGLSFATLFGLRNHFQKLPINELDNDTTKTITEPDYNSEEYSVKITRTYDISDIAKEESFLFNAITEAGDTLSNYIISKKRYALLPEQIFSLEKNPYSERTKVSVRNVENGEIVASKNFDTSPVFQDFNFNPEKPVMIYLDGMDEKGLPYSYEPTLYKKVADATIKIGRNNTQRKIKEHYDDNVLFLEKANYSQWEDISAKLQNYLPDDVKIHVLITDHHGTDDITDVGRYGGLFIHDAGIAELLSLLPCKSENLTVIHDACDVDSVDFKERGNHIFIAPKDNYAFSMVSLFGKVESIADEIIPALSQGANLDKIQQIIDDSYVTKKQNFLNYTVQEVKDMIEPDNNVSMQSPMILKAKDSLEQSR